MKALSARSSAREEFGQPGGFLFGDFSAADAMFAPVVNSLPVYDVDVSAPTRSYMDKLMALLLGRTGLHKLKRNLGLSTNMKLTEKVRGGGS